MWEISDLIIRVWRVSKASGITTAQQELTMTECERKLLLNKVSHRVQEQRSLKRFLAGAIKRLEMDVVAYNVADTSKEKPDIAGITEWDEYWRYFTQQNFSGQKCASCGCRLDNSIRRGAHIRLKGEANNTNKAWIALYCAGCNNSREIQQVRKGSWIVATTMSQAHENVRP